jgi:hypothetical protein
MQRHNPATPGGFPCRRVPRARKTPWYSDGPANMEQSLLAMGSSRESLARVGESGNFHGLWACGGLSACLGAATARSSSAGSRTWAVKWLNPLLNCEDADKPSQNIPEGRISCRQPPSDLHFLSSQVSILRSFKLKFYIACSSQMNFVSKQSSCPENRPVTCIFERSWPTVHDPENVGRSTFLEQSRNGKSPRAITAKTDAVKDGRVTLFEIRRFRR